MFGKARQGLAGYPSAPRGSAPLVLVLALVLMLPAGCDRQGHTQSATTRDAAAATAPPGAPVAEAAKLLAARGAALLHKNEAAFLAVVDPKRTKYQLQQQQLFANLRAVPFTSFQFQIKSWDPMASDVQKRYQPAKIYVANLQTLYRLQGEALPTTGTSTITFVQTAAGWRIGGENDASFADPPTYQLWDGGKLTSLASGRTLVVFRPGTEDLAARLLRSADRAYNKVDQVWGANWTHRAVFVFLSGHTEVHRFLGGDAIEGSLVIPMPARPSDHQDNVVYVSAQRLKGVNDFDLDFDVAYGMTQIATRTVRRVPFLLLNGFGNYVALRALGNNFGDLFPALKRGQSFDGKLVTDDHFSSDADFRIAEDKATTFTMWVADAFGEATLVELYHSFAGSDWPPPTDWTSDQNKAVQALLDQRFRRFLHLSYTATQQRWAAYVRAHL